MRISYKVLKELLNIDKTVDELSYIMNSLMLPIEEVIDTGMDTVFDVEVTPNRPDLLGHIGVAYQLAAKLGLKVLLPDTNYSEAEEEKIEDSISIEIEDSLCRRYTAIVVEDVEIKESPFWLKERIESFGLRSINNIVDISNYVMWITGHPIHTFDLDEISGGKLIIRRAKKGEKIFCLDEVERELTEDDLVIADIEKPLAIAGVIGGEHSGVKDKTRRILIESAYFDPATIRFTSKRHKISTDSSYRFERGADFSATVFAAKFAAHLIEKLASGRVRKGIIDKVKSPLKEKQFKLRYKRVNEILGTDLKKEEIKEFIERLKIEIISEDNNSLSIKIPLRRRDIEREIDVIEEIAILYGFSNIKNTLPLINEEKIYFKEEEKEREKIHLFLQSAGFFETLTYSFISEEENSFSPEGGNAIKLRNPISLQFSQMRLSLLPSLLKVASYNLRRDLKGIKIYELGKVFIEKDEKLNEEERVGIMLSGKFKHSWNEKEKEAEFYELKGAIEGIFQRYEGRLKFSKADYKSLKNAYRIIFNGKEIGFIGEVEAKVREFFGIEHKTFYSEIYYEKLKKEIKLKKAEDVPKFPPLWFDATFVLDESLPYIKIKEFIDSKKVKYLESFYPYYVFKGENIGVNKRALTIRFIFRASDKTLKKDEVENLFFKLRDDIAKEFNIKIK